MPKTDDPALLERLVQEVLGSSKYGDICSALISNVAAQELGRRRNFKEALKATKNKLHQVGGAYLAGREDYVAGLDALRVARETGDAARLRHVSQQLMGYHASTRERLPILDEFYSTLFAELPPIHSVLDIACGLNPLALPWMPLAADVEYYAYDLYQHMMDFLNQYLLLMGIPGQAQACDVIQSCPIRQVDVAFVLKTLPCLEQVDKQAGYRLLRTLNARYLIVSFPAQSLGGKSKGMLTFYETHFRDLLGAEVWSVKKFTFATELVFLVQK